VRILLSRAMSDRLIADDLVNSDQFRCVDYRERGTRVARTFSLPTKKGDTLGQYAHGDVFNNLFAYPVDDDLYM
jgi:hypothetical protein